MNQFLFGIIAFLMASILGVGIANIPAAKESSAATRNNDAVSETVAPSVEVKTQPAPVSAPAAPKPIATTNTTATVKTSTQSAPRPGTYTRAQVAAHNSSKSCYTIIGSTVYDVTPFIQQHPGGSEAILSLCGEDGTEAFSDQHGGQSRPANELASFRIGTLASL